MFKHVLPTFFLSAVSCRTKNLPFIFSYVNSALALGTLCHFVIAGLVALLLPEEMQPDSISLAVALSCLARLPVFSSRTV